MSGSDMTGGDTGGGDVTGRDRVGDDARVTAEPSNDSAPGQPGGDGPGTDGPRGADLALAALEAARARNASSRARRRIVEPGASKRLRRRRWSGPGADGARDPQPLAATMRSFLARADTGGEIVRARLFTEWAQIVGAEIADHAQPVELTDGQLTVQAESTAWATQLRLLAPGMVKKLNQALGHGTVLRIRTRGPAGPSWRFGNRHVPGRGPRDTYG